MPLIMFGIANCDTVKRGKDWLTQRGIEFALHDYKKAGIDRALLETWVEEHGWEVVLNRAGTTFKKLPDSDKANLDARKAVELMIAQPSMIKRPILDVGDRRIVGFKSEIYEAALRPNSTASLPTGIPN